MFHSPQDQWGEHFRWTGGALTGLANMGNVTITVLSMNDPLLVELRLALIDEGAFPPEFPTAH